MFLHYSGVLHGSLCQIIYLFGLSTNVPDVLGLHYLFVYFFYLIFFITVRKKLHFSVNKQFWAFTVSPGTFLYQILYAVAG